ncbi:bifunctional UDP-N-acetylglucosamine diphosphorylase/glucosamine-1-phosphate N-acetyltransferase GlmU [Nitrincola nitratireducens]|uniref:Bifunctional protein GlmU n=1 Tax=Nitrincola nitratireducens TaxID=1229521 RepID=W9V1P5_9GAMM|nr:bifunctional UDP-N-acetylglucosamine diphosphorylase/glucosamine-1-phosphate N-acetyltransferase GlmU [Nitrincola nitratireducens]EXJ10072.1 Bifunctional protein GlmU [Nitrincola nitratireducens]
MKTDIVILAAGQGSRMKSALPKVLHPLAGKPLLFHVIDSASHITDSQLHLVIGHGADQVESAIRDSAADVKLAVQAQQLGTGHAVAQALPNCAEDSIVLILYGDVPLTPNTVFTSLITEANKGQLALLTVTLDDPTGYGRILRNHNNEVVAIVEQKDATPEELQVEEVNTGILAVHVRYLRKWLPLLSSENAQGEYYLTDIIAMAAADGVPIAAIQPQYEQEVQGVNTRSQLAQLERWYQQQLAEALMASGVTLADPSRFDLRGNLSTGTDIFIDINCVFEGDVEIAEQVSIGPNCMIRNSRIGKHTVIEANTHIDGAEIGEHAHLGPFARIRPGTQLGKATKIGNFVETKKAVLGQGSKVNHLSYIGDAIIGESVNIGAGTITCNYDGVNKSTTKIGDNVFVGSNTALVAPVDISANATIAAGSVITKTVEEGQLAIARGQQRNIIGWKRPQKRQS